MAYEGDSLVDLVDRLDTASRMTGRALAESVGDQFQHNIEINTPVETFHLRQSYEQTDIDYRKGYESIRWSAYAWTGKVYTEVDYALYVERGTGLWGPQRKKYIIRPKLPGGVLAFTPYTRGANGAVILDVQGKPTSSGPVFVRFVLHPGSPGQAMFRIGAELTEHEHEIWSREPMRLWARYIETGKV